MRIYANTLFHATTPSAWVRIEKEGLKPRTEMGIIYLSPNPIDASNFGEIVLKVKIREQKLSAFEDCVDWEVLCWDPIPPEDISKTSCENRE